MTDANREGTKQEVIVRDLKYSEENYGAAVTMPQDDMALVADSRSKVTCVGLKKMIALDPVDFSDPIFHFSPRSFVVNPSNNTEVAFSAGEVPYAVVWRHFSGDLLRLNPYSQNLASCVAYSPDGSLLAIGTGFYPMAYRPDQRNEFGSIELWVANGEGYKWMLTAALPGVCCDAIAWSDDGNRLACITGMRNQKYSFVSVFDPATLKPLSQFDLPWAWSNKIAFSPTKPDQIIVQGEEYLISLSMLNGKLDWELEGKGFHDFIVDPCSPDLVTCKGQIVSSATGEVLDQLSALEDCRSLAVHPDGGPLVGVDNKGNLRTWTNWN